VAGWQCQVTRFERLGASFWRLVSSDSSQDGTAKNAKTREGSDVAASVSEGRIEAVSDVARASSPWD